MKKYKLIKEYPGSPKLGSILSNKELQYCNWNEYYQEIIEKDYEILEIQGKYGSISTFYQSTDGDLKDKTIFKIKRLSDGEIFTIGDQTNSGIITQIQLDKIKGLWLDFSTGGSCHGGYDEKNNYKNLKKVKQPLFTTEDGFDVFENKSVYAVRNFKINVVFHTKKYDSTKYFSTVEKAEEYILMNKPCLSINEITNLTETNPQDWLNKELIKIVKSKM